MDLVDRQSEKLRNGRGQTDSCAYLAPFVCLLLHPYFRFLLFTLACYELATAIRVLALSPIIGVANFQDYKISMKNAFSNSSDLPNDMRLFFEDCEIEPPPGATATAYPFQTSFSTARPVSGFEVAWAGQGDFQAPHVLLLGSVDNGSTWSLAGSSSLTWNEGGVLFLDSGTAAVTAGRLRVDFRPPWPFYVHHAAAPCIAAAGCVAALAWARCYSVAGARQLSVS